MGIKESLTDLVLSGLMKIDFMPFAKTKIGAIVLVASEAIAKLPLPEGAPPVPVAEIQAVLQWIGIVLVLYGLTMWKARSAADKAGIAVPFVKKVSRV